MKHRLSMAAAPAIKLALALISALSPVMAAAPAVPSKPNVVFILADDLGYGDVGFHGGSIPTPNLDKLAREGVQMAQHYVAPVCTPSRAGLMTGRYWSRFGVFGVQSIRSLPFDTVTLPRALKSVGYDTALMGKWHLGSLPAWGPNHFGFDYSYGSLGGGVGPFNHFYKKGPFSKTWHRNDDLITEAGQATDLIGNEAVKWIDERSDKPFLLYVPFTAVHIPIKEPREWLDKVRPELIEALNRDYAADHARPEHAQAPWVVGNMVAADYAKNEPATIEMTRNYAACVMHLDYEVGRIVAELEKKGKRQNTLIVFTSDNGAPTGYENNDTQYPADDYASGPVTGSNRPLRGFKGGLYEGGIHVAAVANWPGVLTPRTVPEPVVIVDWMPTLCALAGYAPGTDLKWDGIDIWPYLTGAKVVPAARVLYCASTAGKELRDGDWKLILLQGPRGTAGPTELYNLANDPGETTNLASQMPERVQSLKQRLSVASKADRDAMVPKAERDAMTPKADKNSRE